VFVIQRKPERFDQVERRSGRQRESSGGPRVVGNLRFDEHDVEHGGGFQEGSLRRARVIESPSAPMKIR
jgi:hypothetical protein